MLYNFQCCLDGEVPKTKIQSKLFNISHAAHMPTSSGQHCKIYDMRLAVDCYLQPRSQALSPLSP